MDYGLLSPCLHFTHTVTRINTKLSSDGRLTLSGWLLNRLDSPGLAWRTKKSLFCWESIKETFLLCQVNFLTKYGMYRCRFPQVCLRKLLAGHL